MLQDADRRRQMAAFEAMSSTSADPFGGASAAAKLVQTKQRWAGPCGRPIDISCAAAANWSLTVTGAVQRPLHWDWAALLRQPQEQRTNNIHCVTFWSRFDNLCAGIPIHHLLAAVKPKPEARFVIIRGYDGYATNLPSTSSTMRRCCWPPIGRDNHSASSIGLGTSGGSRPIFFEERGVDPLDVDFRP